MVEGVRTLDRAAPAAAAPTPRRRSLRRAVLLTALALILAQLALRGWIAARGYFYWDDLILVGRAGRYDLFSADLLLHDHDGHFMPLAFATAWVLTRAAPLVWAGPVLTMVVLQLAASLAVLRMLLVLLGRRPVVLIPLAFYLFCPLTLPAFVWWAAALNALPLQIALAWLIADAVRLVRTGRIRFAWSGIAVLVVALSFFEKSVVVPFTAFAAAALALHVRGIPRPVRTVARRGRVLWLGSAVVLAGWAAVYLSVVDLTSEPHDRHDVGELVRSATGRGVVPALFGGPWRWERWVPATPWAAPPGWVVAACWVLTGLAVALVLARRRHVLPVLAAAIGYVVLAQLPLALLRSGPHTATEIMQSLRYLADVAVVLTVAAALVCRAPARRGGPVPFRRPAFALTAAFVAGSLVSTLTYADSWWTNRTRTYLPTVAAELPRQDAPLLEQEVPWEVLAPVAYPQNLTGQVFAPIAGEDAFADSTPRLRMITDDGHIVDAVVWWNRHILPGPEPGCDHRVTGPTPVDLPLDGPMIENKWTAQLNYLADRDGRITVALGDGEPVVVPVRAGVHTVYVRVIGGGTALRVGAFTPGLGLCIGVGPVGVASFDR
ncbi:MULTISPECIES: hypothetical protein [Nocardia]|uniref:hypothetical protein n=1 Tax=Nocardia TaxID=1817 RepID=UPI000BF050B6|nr:MULTISPECIES: hypothetical protein [Nocardia]MBF6184528.1 hypothetical protein [Nocardia farcinica]MBF6310372.1 hypothetical protein [Nocardia farcinica]MBF6405809.1 hypothetical protein [Nocardia farcinica]PEH75453.1 hypothetical protein CRM89_05135 [Nocardia sp. FDAARGOS_372]UEX25024.1 hypothetical protein LMJ57_11415 [Nocardia farcinica]